MTLSLAEASSAAELVISSWETIQGENNDEEIGMMLYDMLFEIAPTVKRFFKAPKEQMAVKLVSMISEIVAFVEGDREERAESMMRLAVRHVQMGVEKQHIPLMTHVLISTIERSAAEHWTDEMHKAWMGLFKAIGDELMYGMEEIQLHGSKVPVLWPEIQAHLSLGKFGFQIYSQLALTRPDFANDFLENLRNEVAHTRCSSYSKTLEANFAKKCSYKKESALRISSVMAAGKSYGSNPPGGGSGGWSGDASLNGNCSPTKLTKQGTSQSMAQSHSMTQTLFKALHHTSGFGHGDSSDDEHSIYIPLGQEIEYLFACCAEHVFSEPGRLQEKLVVLGIRYHQLGMLHEHVQTLKGAILSALQECLPHLEKEAMDTMEWMLSRVCISLINVLTSEEKGETAAVAKMWAENKEDVCGGEAGQLFYEVCEDGFPELLDLFYKPASIISHVLQNMFDFVLSAAHDPGPFFEKMKMISVKHIKYGVTSEHIKPFEKAVQATLWRLLSHLKCPELEHAVAVVWKRALAALQRNLTIGTNLITTSLVQGNLEKFAFAVSLSPRQERNQTLCMLDVVGEIESPLRWSISEGMYHLAKFIIRDLLTIRADRRAYYYGRAEMWEAHPDVLQLVFAFCSTSSEDLISDFLDGHVWYSSHVEPGHLIRVNYYIKELWGDPHVHRNIWETPLQVLIEHCSPSLFQHPVIREVIHLKWQKFGKMYLVVNMCFYSILLIFFIVDDVVNQHDCEYRILRMVVALIALLAGVAQILLVFYQIFTRQFMSIRIARGTSLLLPRWLSVYNFIRIVAGFLMFFCLLMDPCWGRDDDGWGRWVEDTNATSNVTWVVDDSGGRRTVADGMVSHLRAKLKPGGAGSSTDEVYVAPTKRQEMAAVVSIILWLQLIQGLVFSKRLSAFTYTLGKLLADLTHNITVICIILLAFSTALAALQETNYATPAQAMRSLIYEVIGINSPLYDLASPFGMTLVTVCVAFVTVGMLNILIAQLSMSYEQLSLEKNGFAMKNKASLCMEIEALLPKSLRQHFFDSYGFEEPLEFDSCDYGPPGGVHRLLDASVRSTPRYCPDRIIRFTGDASQPSEPWPELVDKPTD